MRFELFGIVAVVIFTVFVTVFAASADARSIRALPKWVWLLLCIFFTPAGGILYLIFGRPLSGGGDRPSTRIVAPDDDPNFLRDLARRMREEGDEHK